MSSLCLRGTLGSCNAYSTVVFIIQFCSEITCGRVLNGVLYAQKLMKLICSDDWSEIFMKQSVNECR